MRIHCFQHVPFEDPGFILRWAQSQGHSVTHTRLHLGESPLDPDGFDLLVVMGGPMGVADTAAFPWLVAENQAIGRAIDGGRRVLGICLGAQLIAHAMGALVHDGPRKEIGWFGVQTTEAAASDAFFSGLPKTFDAFHWHGQTFDLPSGATHLAASAACKNQAFSWAGRVLGLQFHLEIEETGITRLIDACPEDLKPAPFVQPKTEMTDQADRLRAAHETMGIILDTFARR